MKIFKTVTISCTRFVRFLYYYPRLSLLLQDTKERKGLYRHIAFQSVINKMWFKSKTDEGVIHPEFSEGGMLSQVTKALTITVVRT